jgi:thioredoxin reductase
LQRPSFVIDVVIAGGGPAGLSAALVLGRCRRRVLLCDTGRPRNARSRSLNGYLSRDGIAPLELLRIGRDELRQYGVESRQVGVETVTPNADGFDVLLSNGNHVATLAVLLATGVVDQPPDILGLNECYGISVHHCPYCDGWECRDRRIAVIAERTSPAGLALSLKTWSNDVIACTNGGRLRAGQREHLAEQGIPVHTRRIRRIEHDAGHVRSIVFEPDGPPSIDAQIADDDRLPCDAIFFTAPQSQQCDLARRLGCEFTSKGTVKTDHLGQTCVDGIYVVGDASRDVQFAIVAAAEGAKAGVAINQALQARSGLKLVGRHGPGAGFEGRRLRNIGAARPESDGKAPR